MEEEDVDEDEFELLDDDGRDWVGVCVWFGALIVCVCCGGVPNGLVLI